MKIVVIYKSKTGFVKKYAEWIAVALKADIFEFRQFHKDQFSLYDVVIFGGGLYVGGINGLKLITQNMEKLEGKEIVVFATGATPNREETTQELFDLNFSKYYADRIKFYYLRGGFDFSKLGIVDKFLMILLKLKLKSKKESKRNPDEKGMLAAYEAPCDFSKIKYIEPIIDYIASFKNE